MPNCLHPSSKFPAKSAFMGKLEPYNIEFEMQLDSGNLVYPPNWPCLPVCVGLVWHSCQFGLPFNISYNSVFPKIQSWCTNLIIWESYFSVLMWANMELIKVHAISPQVLVSVQNRFLTKSADFSPVLISVVL